MSPSNEVPENHGGKTADHPLPTDQETVLESDLSLSHSLIWRRQREFYVQRGMRDCSEDLVQSWRENHYLTEFVECGILEFGVLQAGEKIDLSILRKDSLPNGPLVLIANYVFDSLPQDAFVMNEGKISEALITT